MHFFITHIAQNQGQKNAVKKKKDKNNAAACDNAEKKSSATGDRKNPSSVSRAHVGCTDDRVIGPGTL